MKLLNRQRQRVASKIAAYSIAKMAWPVRPDRRRKFNTTKKVGTSCVLKRVPTVRKRVEGLVDVEASTCQVPRSDIKDVYVRIPHCLKGSVPLDVLERVRKFYRQTFWCNIAAFKCCQAAQALAKRGHNVVRIFIGLSAGGVGQSLYSAHLQAGGNLSSKG